MLNQSKTQPQMALHAIVGFGDIGRGYGDITTSDIINGGWPSCILSYEGIYKDNCQIGAIMLVVGPIEKEVQESDYICKVLKHITRDEGNTMLKEDNANAMYRMTYRKVLTEIREQLINY